MEDSEIREIIPEGWLTSYVDYCKEITDSPLIFNLMSGLSVLAATAGSNITFKGFGGIETWCNLYTLLVAPSGNFRKSTALAIAKRILNGADPTLVLSNEFTRESFLGNLKQQPSSIMFLTEFSSQLSSWGREYMAGMKEIVTELFDPVNLYRRKTQKEMIEIERPALSILAASTADWLMERLTAGDLRGGLVGRFLVCGATVKGKWMGLSEERYDRNWESVLSDYLKAVCETKHTIVDLKLIRDKFNIWLHGIEQNSGQLVTPEMVGFTSRIGSHTLKLAILFMLSKSIQEKAIVLNPALDHDSLDRAQALMEGILTGLKDLTENTLVFSKTEQQIQGLLNRISGGIEHSQLLKRSHLKKDEFTRIIETMKSRGEISERIKKTEGRSAVWYIPATKGASFTPLLSQESEAKKASFPSNSRFLPTQNVKEVLEETIPF